MLKPYFISLALLFLALCFTVPAFAEESATMHQVYLAAEAGKFKEAQAMMDKVLSDHPNSAKAHFVEAELLAKQGLFSNAGIELNTAERLQPGLPFVKPEVLQNLKRRIASVPTSAGQPTIAGQSPLSIAKNGMPLILLVLGIGLVVLLISFISRRNSRETPINSYASNASGQKTPPFGTSGAGAVMGQPATGGMGSGIMGSLATGAALGAGVVAGEALMHHFTDGNKSTIVSEPPLPDASPWSTSSDINDNDDMGGNDFGIADSSSWDDDDSANDGNDDWS